MFLMYVDESGDCGITRSPTRFFVLTGLVVHELRWQTYLDRMIAFRRRMKERYGLQMREEIHAAALLTRPGALVRIKRYDRLAILRAFANELGSMRELNIINVVVDKSGKHSEYDVFGSAWTAMIQRFENTISHRNFSGPANPDERGMLFPDRTDDKKLTQLLRQARRFNPIPNKPQFGLGFRDMPVTRIIGDPNFRESKDSYFVQAADLAAFLLYQKLAPSKYMKAKSGHNYFNMIDPILCKAASTTDPLGIVRL